MSRARATSDLMGVVRVDKPAGPTSHDAVRVARRSLGERRIGHTGTLDPFATGLLILLVGPATRLADTLNPLEKHYSATIMLGIETDTADCTGTVVQELGGADQLTRSQVETALQMQIGTILQHPPRYSSKKVDGVAAHRRVRRGEDVELSASEVTVHSITVTRFDPPEVDVEIACSTGTYIRSIARDVGRELQVGGHLTALRRTAIGPYTVDGALVWEALEDPDRARAGVTPTAEGLQHLSRFEVGGEDLALLRTGRTVEIPEGVDTRSLLLATSGGTVVSVGQSEEGRFVPKKVFPDGA